MNADTRKELESIARRHDTRLVELFSKLTFRKLCEARRECYRFLHRERGWSTTQIGRLFNRDHSTIVWALDNRGTVEAKKARRKERYRRIKAAGERPLGARRAA